MLHHFLTRFRVKDLLAISTQLPSHSYPLSRRSSHPYSFPRNISRKIVTKVFRLCRFSIEVLCNYRLIRATRAQTNPCAFVYVGLRICTFACVCIQATAWNSLPDHVKNASSLEIFKSKLKTHLFKQSYN